jgi:histidyl-tRNA synthetase
MQIPQTLKGFRDFLPPQALKRQWLKDKIVEVFELWGYDPMETPTLEPLELFAGQIGEDEKLFFKFKDPGDRDVALRYDQTVPTCRVVGQYNQQLALPFRRYQIQPAFRAENTQKGRYREFVQCDADIFGVESPLADAEVIALSLDIYRKIGFTQAKVLINDRSLLKDMPYAAIVAIDKLGKIGEEGVIQEMVKKNIDADTARGYLKYIQELQPNETITTILNYLEKQGFDKSWYEFDPTIARSFSYSTGPIWEVVIPGSSGSVLGGERFDKLVEKIGGVAIPATGFGLGFDRTLEIAEEMKLVPDFLTKTKVLVTLFEDKLLDKSLEAASTLRKAGVSTELYPDPTKKVAKQLTYANKKGIPFVIIIGEDEVKQNKVMVKNMKSGEQSLLSIDEAIQIISN